MTRAALRPTPGPSSDADSSGALDLVAESEAVSPDRVRCSRQRPDDRHARVFSAIHDKKSSAGKLNGSASKAGGAFGSKAISVGQPRRPRTRGLVGGAEVTTPADRVRPNLPKAISPDRARPRGPDPPLTGRRHRERRRVSGRVHGAHHVFERATVSRRDEDERELGAFADRSRNRALTPLRSRPR